MEMRSSLAWSRALELNGGEGAGPSGWGVSLKSGEAPVIPRSEKEGTKPPYVCPGCSNHTHGNNMINRCNVINKRVIFLT